MGGAGGGGGGSGASVSFTKLKGSSFFYGHAGIAWRRVTRGGGGGQVRRGGGAQAWHHRCWHFAGAGVALCCCWLAHRAPASRGTKHQRPSCPPYPLLSSLLLPEPWGRPQACPPTAKGFAGRQQAECGAGGAFEAGLTAGEEGGAGGCAHMRRVRQQARRVGQGAARTPCMNQAPDPQPHSTHPQSPSATSPGLHRRQGQLRGPSRHAPRVNPAGPLPPTHHVAQRPCLGLHQ